MLLVRHAGKARAKALNIITDFRITTSDRPFTAECNFSLETQRLILAAAHGFAFLLRAAYSNDSMGQAALINRSFYHSGFPCSNTDACIRLLPDRCANP